MSEPTLTIQTEATKETITAFERAVDGLDLLHMIIGNELKDPDPQRDMEDYLVRAIDYLTFLRDRIEADDLVHVATMPLSESLLYRRIGQLLRKALKDLSA